MTNPTTSTAFIAYYRVSTARQGRSGLGLEAQREAVQRHVQTVGGNLIDPAFTEVETGKRSDRPELLKALAACRARKATLIVAKLDRLSRNVAFLAALMESKVDFIAADNPHATRFTVHILAAVAEHEAAAISKRTREALAAAKARGTVLGGRREGSADIRRHQAAGSGANAEAAHARLSDVAHDLKTLAVDGKPLRTIAHELNARHIRAPRGGDWNATAVRRALMRLNTA
jgi:DNA invertase Pin-like site-specific DNA recombinase